MNETLVTLCTVIIFMGLMKCILSGSAIEKHFSLVCGLLFLVILTGGLMKIDFSTDTAIKGPTVQGGDYEELVEKKATSLVEKNLCNALKSRYDYSCKAEVSLAYANGSYFIDRVEIEGGREVGYIRSFISDYLCLDERCIYFA